MTDPLNIEIKQEGVDTSFPLMAEGDVDFQIVESVPKPNKKQTGYNWHLKLASISETPNNDPSKGPIAPNSNVFLDIALQPAEGAEDPNGFRRGIADATDAIFGTDKNNRPDFNKKLWEDALGKTVKAQIYVDEYPKGSGNFSNKVRRLKKATA